MPHRGSDWDFVGTPLSSFPLEGILERSLIGAVRGMGRERGSESYLSSCLLSENSDVIV